MMAALLLSLSLTLLLGALYTFYPLIALILTGLWNRIASSQPDSGGIVAIAGGVSESFLMVLMAVATILFIIIFASLQKRTVKH
jgi:hypothetical protein